MKRLHLCCLVFSLFTVVSCGGGGGSSTPFFGGVWRGGLQLVEDSCGGVVQFAFFNHLINQDEFSVVLDNGFLTFSGTLQTDSSFSVSTERGSSNVFPGAACTEEITWRYEAINEESGQADFVVRRSEVRCSEEGLPPACAFAFSGSALRSTRDEFGPIPVDVPIDLDLPVASAEADGLTNAADL